jgi:DnaJ-domain-containing protein 1
MEYLSDLDRGYGTTMQQNRETMEAPAANRPEPASPFVGDFQQLLGEGSDPDPLFFMETWTLGTPAALENFKQRQLMQADRTESRSDREPGNLSNHSFVHPHPFNWSVFVSVHAVVQDNCNPTPSQRSSIDLELGPLEISPDGLRNQDKSLPMTLERACNLLGVTGTSTLCQIKAAHRQLVIQWHPDRLQNQTEEVRRYATEKMASINEAYRLVRNDLLQQQST